MIIKFESFHKRGLHFLHINISSLLLKIDELRDFVCHTKPTISGITESKLDSTVCDQEVNVNDYTKSDSNRTGGAVACYARADLCFNSSNIFSDSVELVFFV